MIIYLFIIPIPIQCFEKKTQIYTYESQLHAKVLK